jgi:oligopeptide/dipeptide ABC transporter ATP-binding protein
MAVSCDLELLIADEPTTALDVTIQVQILDLLDELQEQNGMDILLITHDLDVSKFFCDIITVMYTGRIMKLSTTEEVYQNSLHLYIHALTSATPTVNAFRHSQREALDDEMLSDLNPPGRGAFGPRCPLAEEDCLKQIPALKEISGYGGHFVACWKC